MNKFIKQIIYFSLRHRYLIFFFTAVMAVIGIFCYSSTPIETFPDVTNTQIIVITQWPGRSAEEVEKFITIPLETELNSVQKKVNLRTVSSFGLSYIRIIFEDNVEDAFGRQQVLSRIVNADLPDGVKPEIEPPYGPTDEIYRYTLKSPTKSVRDLTTIQEWFLDKQFKSVSGIADVNSFGGEEKIFEISVNPDMLMQYGLTALDVYNAVNKSNINVGGDVIEKNGQAFVVRGIGLLNNIDEIKNIIITNLNDVPILVKNVAEVKEAGKPRLGRVSRNDQDDVVEGILVMRKGENQRKVLDAIHEKVDQLNKKLAKQDVRIVPFYDRTTLMDFCTETVIHNLIEGIILVTVVVFLFMAEWRTTLIVAMIIPLALLFAFTCLKLKGMTANLLSMGAVDFGIIIDGAVVMVEGIFVAMDHMSREMGMEKYNKLIKLGAFKTVATEKAKAIFFSKLIIITCLLPIFAFQKVEGKMFAPLAYTLGFALLGSLIYTLTLVPALSSILLRKNVREKHNPIVIGLERLVDKAAAFTLRFWKGSLIVAFAVMSLTFFSTRFLGTEFLPKLNEGALWITAQLPINSSLNSSYEISRKMYEVLKSFPEVRNVLVQIGRTNDGTDPKGFANVQIAVDLYPKKEWKRKISMDELSEQMNRKLMAYPGIVFNFAQPISDNVAEAVAGVPAENALKIFGPDVKMLEQKSKEAQEILKTIPGVADLGEFKVEGQPEFRIELDQEKMALYGVNVTDANSIIEMALGGKAATTLYDNEKRFDIRIRYQKEYRDEDSKIESLMVPTGSGTRVPLKNIAEIRKITGPAFIYRDNNSRYIGVKFSVRDRDLGSTIMECQKVIGQKLKLPDDYSIAWNGEFENQQRAQHTLATVVPVCLLMIFILLFVAFGNVKDAVIVLMDVPFALIGGILALHLRGMNFSISAGIGFIALAGICVQDGVILITQFRHNLEAKMPLHKAIHEGVVSRVRPVVMTALMAAIGLSPAAFSSGIGSESQKPLATVVIGGLVTSTILTLLILPIIYTVAHKIIHNRDARRQQRRAGK
ncbi:efflux RND transporter permease subunit [Taibaiella soli]|uniref:CusA/CzcA family heavy metal efflux RND transporter n=1 Tax=Taibaiella soli TaxID=1649169 RepID=A0A2W2ATV6_9BACT|nr:CusA/CzcA family heavy metal efflux RND transporter [Taibaiella soli]PZF71394.1 CusA/CzcA family heavy metal efflux RND transporter [Taibaiella soli]